MSPTGAPGTRHLRYRSATKRDASGIATLHADSWRRNYRAAYSDHFLDHDVVSDRLAVWTERMSCRRPAAHTLVAELEGRIVGFAHTIVDDDRKWGALLENLHVANELRRRGVGRELMVGTARALVERTPSRALHLWVLEQNTSAQAFYDAMGGTRVERARAPAPGGDPARLKGSPARLRYVWLDPSVLID